MADRAGPPLATAAALLERAYRLALVLERQPGDFERFVLAAELVAVLDEARAALLGRADGP